MDAMPRLRDPYSRYPFSSFPLPSTAIVTAAARASFLMFASDAERALAEKQLYVSISSSMTCPGHAGAHASSQALFPEIELWADGPTTRMSESCFAVKNDLSRAGLLFAMSRPLRALMCSAGA